MPNWNSRDRYLHNGNVGDVEIFLYYDTLVRSSRHLLYLFVALVFSQRLAFAVMRVIYTTKIKTSGVRTGSIRATPDGGGSRKSGVLNGIRRRNRVGRKSVTV